MDFKSSDEIALVYFRKFHFYKDSPISWCFFEIIYVITQSKRRKSDKCIMWAALSLNLIWHARNIKMFVSQIIGTYIASPFGSDPWPSNICR